MVSGVSDTLNSRLDICDGGGVGARDGSGGALQVVGRSRPVPGEELVEAGVWPEIDEAGENVGEIPIRIDAGELAGLDQRSDDGPVFCAVIVAGKERILACERLRAHGAFDDV